jgi:hypothetical protein
LSLDVLFKRVGFVVVSSATYCPFVFHSSVIVLHLNVIQIIQTISNVQNHLSLIMYRNINQFIFNSFLTIINYCETQFYQNQFFSPQNQSHIKTLFGKVRF